MPGDDAGRHRNQRHQQRAQRGEREQEQSDDDHRAEDGEAFDLGLDALARIDGEAGRARDDEAKPGSRDGIEGRPDRAQRALLAVEVGAVGARRRQQQRARRLARDPDAVLALRRSRRRQRFGDPHRLAGRIAKQDRLQQRAGGRAEQRDGLVDRIAQAGAAEARRVDGGAELVAVLEHELAGVGPGGVLAIGDRCEQLVAAQRRSEPARSVGARRGGAGGIGSGRRAFDRDQQQA